MTQKVNERFFRKIISNDGNCQYTMPKLQFRPKNGKVKYTIPYKKDISQIIKVAHGLYEESVIKHNWISATVKKNFHLIQIGV